MSEYQIKKMRPQDYQISGVVALDDGTFDLTGSLYRTSDDGQRWNWMIGYRKEPRERGVWRKGKEGTMREAKEKIAAAYRDLIS